jgi:hypothetical protein
LRLCSRYKILSREFNAGLNGFRPTTDQKNPVKTPLGQAHNFLGEILGGLIFELCPVGKRDLVKLLIHSGSDRWMTVPKIARYRPGARIEITFPQCVPHKRTAPMAYSGEVFPGLVKKCGLGETVAHLSIHCIQHPHVGFATCKSHEKFPQSR